MLRKLVVVFILAGLLAACAAPATSAPTPLAGGQAAAPTAGAPTAPPEPTSGSKNLRWDAPPPMAIDPAKHYLATFETANGQFEIELLPAYAPVTVNNFVFLANQGYYDGTTFHRVLEGFMAQGGDPTGSGTGGPGYQFQDEFDPALRFDGEGWLAMANAGAGTNGSQFFITFAPTPHLNDAHTIFGKVVSGMEVVKATRLRDPGANPDYPGDTLVKVTISEMAESRLPAMPTPMPTPEPRAPVLADDRPLASLDLSAREDVYNTAPDLIIDPAAAYTATLITSLGEIVIALDAQAAPQSVNNFVILASLGYWDGFPFVFVEPGSLALTGSPRAQPDSDVGYGLPAEIGRFNLAGAVGYWVNGDTGAGSSGSQFYILLADNAQMEGQFTVFGQVAAGLEVAAQLTMNDSVLSVQIEGPGLP